MSSFPSNFPCLLPSPAPLLKPSAFTFSLALYINKTMDNEQAKRAREAKFSKIILCLCTEANQIQKDLRKPISYQFFVSFPNCFQLYPLASSATDRSVYCTILDILVMRIINKTEQYQSWRDHPGSNHSTEIHANRCRNIYA